jgi:hypothetical protein
VFREQVAALVSLVLLASKVRAVQQASRELVASKVRLASWALLVLQVPQASRELVAFKELAVLRELQALAASKEQAAVPARPVPLVLWAQLAAPDL